MFLPMGVNAGGSVSYFQGVKAYRSSCAHPGDNLPSCVKHVNPLPLLLPVERKQRGSRIFGDYELASSVRPPQSEIHH